MTKHGASKGENFHPQPLQETNYPPSLAFSADFNKSCTWQSLISTGASHVCMPWPLCVSSTSRSSSGFTCEVLDDSCHVHGRPDPDAVLVCAFLQVAHHPPHGEDHPGPARAGQLRHFLLPAPPRHLVALCFSISWWFSVPCSKPEGCKRKPMGLMRNVSMRCCCSRSKNPNPPSMPVKVQALFVKRGITGIFAVTLLLNCTVSVAISGKQILVSHFSGNHKITDKQTTNSGIHYSTPKLACGHSYTPSSHSQSNNVWERLNSIYKNCF